MSTYVLVHGAWHGGWAWRHVRHILEQQGHNVFTPTMTGLGERTHLLSKDITLDTVIEDITNVLRYEDLHDVILVGHSFAGTVITGVAERVPDRIRQLIYLDAAILEDGETLFSRMPAHIAEERQQLALETSGGISLPIPNAEALGILDDEQWASVETFLTPHPLATYSTPITLKRRPGEGFPCCHIVCTSPAYEPLAWARERMKAYGWPEFPIETGHDAMISAPELLADLLLKSAE